MKKERVLVYIKGSSLTEDQEKMLDDLHRPYSCRNSQFFKNTENNFKEVINLSGDPKIDEAYKGKIISIKKEEPKPADPVIEDDNKKGPKSQSKDK